MRGRKDEFRPGATLKRKQGPRDTRWPDSAWGLNTFDIKTRRGLGKAMVYWPGRESTMLEKWVWGPEFTSAGQFYLAVARLLAHQPKSLHEYCSPLSIHHVRILLSCPGSWRLNQFLGELQEVCFQVPITVNWYSPSDTVNRMDNI